MERSAAGKCAEGQLVSGFPKDFILDSKALITASYEINYDPKLNQYTAIFSSDQSMTSLFDKYKSYFSKSGWITAGEITKYSVSRGLYFLKDSNQTSVSIIDQGSSRKVIVSYVKK